MEINPKIESTWREKLEQEFQKDYFSNIKQTIIADIQAHKVLYPPMPLIFNAFNTTPFDDVKVVILGQDPYHWENQAHGLSFSVQDGVLFPPSLKNIFKEVKADIGKEIPKSWNLERWAKDWVLLLNAILTVRAGEPASHAKIGWEQFTDAVIKTISDKKEGIVFLLWGNFAKSKKLLIDTKKHFVLEASHPSPLGAHKGFFGCKHFSKTNDILKKLGKKEIEW
jgi:uracil-DNA glycosylase